MSTLFIADIHLCAQKPTLTAGFLHFLRTRAITAKSLYILGDLFEIWIGDDDPNPLHNEIANALKVLTQHGIPYYFIHGNHDFLLGEHYANSCSMILLPKQQVMQLAKLRIVILHGDILCTNDYNYQCFRKIIHQRWLQKLFLSLPLRSRLKISNKMRINSLYINTHKTSNIMDVNTEAVIKIMKDTDTTVMIHGHTHRPAIHLMPGKLLRAVVGAWDNQGSVVEVSSKDIVLHEFHFGS